MRNLTGPLADVSEIRDTLFLTGMEQKRSRFDRIKLLLHRARVRRSFKVRKQIYLVNFK